MHLEHVDEKLAMETANKLMELYYRGKTASAAIGELPELEKFWVRVAMQFGWNYLPAVGEKGLHPVIFQKVSDGPFNHFEHIDAKMANETASALLDSLAASGVNMQDMYPHNLPGLIVDWLKVTSAFRYNYRPERRDYRPSGWIYFWQGA
jgi:hypothetical protein